MANKVNYSLNSPNYTPNAQVRAAYGMPRTIDYITIHWWGDPKTNPSYEGVVSWLCQPRAQVSAHDVVTGTGNRVAVLVNYNDAAWHAGSARGNATTLGHELDPRCRPEDYKAAAQNIADTWKYYGRVIPLRGHKTWSSTQCPGNYDLNKLHNMAMAIYKPAPAAPKPAPAPAVKETSRKIYNPVKKFKFNKDARLYNIVSNSASTSTVYKNNAPIDIKQLLTMSNGKKFYRTSYSSDNEVGTGFRAEDLTEVVAPVVIPPKPVEPEWIRNLVDITDKKLTVTKAEGAIVLNLATGQVIPSTIIPKGTQVDIAKETTIGGKKHYLTSWSVAHGASNGVLASDLGVPVAPPVVEKPEWLENLEDITDKDVWTRSTTPILTLENGVVAYEVAVNQKLRITHATEILGQPLLVLEGGKLAIETVYASDKELSNPNEDIEKRLNALEIIVKSISDFLSSIFNGFKAK